MQDFAAAMAFVAALTQSDPNTAVIDLRYIHDVRKDLPAIPRRGTLPELWNEAVNWNNSGHGVFINVADLDGNGLEVANVRAVRCQVIDLDNLSAAQNLADAAAFNPPPSFAVQSSPGKFHCYWQTTYHRNLDGFTLLQRKLRTLFDGDKKVVDPARVLRLPGCYHLKNPDAPHLITWWSLAGYGNVLDPTFLEVTLSNVNVYDGFGGRKNLGDIELSAPGRDWLLRAIAEIDVNAMSRDEWVSFTAAYKQAGWLWFSEQELYDHWAEWSGSYDIGNGQRPSVQYLNKNWNSVRNTEIGWPSIVHRVPSIKAMQIFGEKRQEYVAQTQQLAAEQPKPGAGIGADVSALPRPAVSALEMPTGEFLTETEQRQWFDGCVFVERMGEILTRNGRFMNSTQFNGSSYAGRKFIIDGAGKTTTEAWQAALRSTLWQIPKVDHIRFMPSLPTSEIITDALGRRGVNTYIPARIVSKEGDVAPFLNHLALMFPSPTDREILLQYMAHNVKFPGYKIPWAPMIQSVEGVGKTMFKLVMQAAIGANYTYEPKARDLVESGSKFNAWMRSKLFILVDEIKTDERRDMIEVLKPMISEERIEVQAKGVDQDIEDNFSNWMFFSNHKDAIPIDKNSRRFAIFYSQIQSKVDLDRLGMNDAYFKWLYEDWFKAVGGPIVAHYLLNYPIERGTIPMRAPLTTSTYEAVRQSRGPVETVILDAIADALPGFRGGWISSIAVAKRLKAIGARNVSAKTLGTICEMLGYHAIGRADRPYWAEDKETRADLFHWDRSARVETFGFAQGYGN